MDSNRIQIGNTIYSRAADGYLTPIATIPAPTPKATTPDGKKGMLDYYLGGTGIPERLRAVNNIFNPVEAVGQSMDASRRMFAPSATGWERTQAAGDMLSGVASVLPLGKIVGATDDLARGAMKVENAARDFAVDEFGGVGLSDPIATRGAQIMDMLRSGRGADVTDDMLDMGDPVANARLNEWLFNNYDLPMDAASRAARAGEMGMDTAAYHATKADFQAFRPGWRGSNYFAQTAEDATRGATFGALDNASPTSGTGGAVTDRVMSVMMPGDEVARLRPSRSAWDALPAEITPAQAKNMAEGAKRTTGASYLSDIYEEVEVRPPQWDARDNLIDPGEYRLVKKPFPAAQYGDLNGRDGMGYMLPGFNSGTDVAALEALSRNTGQKGFLVNDEAGTTIVAGPDMPIRSRFARFDPRLAHLRNLSASGLLPFAAFFGLDKEQQ